MEDPFPLCPQHFFGTFVLAGWVFLTNIHISLFWVSFQTGVFILQTISAPHNYILLLSVLGFPLKITLSTFMSISSPKTKCFCSEENLPPPMPLPLNNFFPSDFHTLVWHASGSPCLQVFGLYYPTNNRDGDSILVLCSRLPFSLFLSFPAGQFSLGSLLF